MVSDGYIWVVTVRAPPPLGISDGCISDGCRNWSIYIKKRQLEKLAIKQQTDEQVILATLNDEKAQ